MRLLDRLWVVVSLFSLHGIEVKVPCCCAGRTGNNGDGPRYFGSFNANRRYGSASKTCAQSARMRLSGEARLEETVLA
jgi:hypothetical protein